MATIPLVRAMLAFQSEVVRASLFKAYNYPKDDDRATWETILPEAFDGGAEAFTPIPLSRALEVATEHGEDWKKVEIELGIPTIGPYNPEDTEIDESFTLEIIPLTSMFVEAVLDDNGTNGISATAIEPGFTCSIYDQPYVILSVLGEGIIIGKEKLESVLAVPACLIDRES